MQDNFIRKEALNPFKSFIVQAPAGSGKTQLLTSRILSLLAHRVQSPESILAMTFTKKAANEMKRRVIQALILAKGPKPEKEHEAALWELAWAVLKKDETYQWGLLENPQRLRIMTIDALCSSITHQLPLSSRLGANPTCIEHAEQVYLQAAQNTVNLLLKEGNSSLETLLLHMNNNQNNACESIAQMLAKREQWLGLIYAHNINESTLRKTLENNIEIVLKDSFEKALEKTWGIDWDGLGLYLSFAAGNMESAFLQDEMMSWANLTPDMENFEKWRALCRWLCTQEGELRKAVDKRQGFPAASNFKDKMEKARAKDMKDNFIYWLDQVREDIDACEAIKDIIFFPDPVYTDQQWDILKSLFNVLPKAVEQLYLLFESRGETDFTAVARCAITALGGEDNPTDLDLKLDYALHHILVDEFQDTSVAQFDLIRRLVSHWENNGEKTLFLVGDPMQSIYRFRQAEVGGFLQAQLHGIGPIRLENINLSTNFRSQKPVIDWINEKMPSAFAPKEDIYLGAITYAPFEPQLLASENSGVFVQWQDLISTLNALLSNESIKTIAILVRIRNHIAPMLSALRAANIPYQAVEIEEITQTPCVRQLFQLTQAYLNIAHHQAWAAVLMSPYIGLSLADLTHLKNHAPTYYQAFSSWENIEGLSETAREILTRIAPVFIFALRNKNRQPLSAAIESLWFMLGGPASLPSENLVDAQPFIELLHECDQGGTLNIIEFEKRLEKLYSNATQIANIQIMTIHHAKGLEFDAVLIPGMDRAPSKADRSLLLCESCFVDNENILLFAPVAEAQGQKDAMYEFILQKHKIREKHEYARLLYVALTRAKKQLHLFGEGKTKPKSFFELLAIESNFIEPISDESFLQHTVLKRLNPEWKNPCFDLKNLNVEDTFNPIDHNMILPSRFDDKTLGTLIHKELYLWAEYPHLMHQSIDMHMPRWRAMLLESGLNVLHLDWMKAVMQRVKEDPIAQDILSPQQDAKSEFEITALIDDKPKTFIIDRTFIDKDGVRVIVDYKTSAYDESAFEKHRMQLESYAKVMQSMENRAIKLCLYFPVTGHRVFTHFENTKEINYE